MSLVRTLWALVCGWSKRSRSKYLRRLAAGLSARHEQFTTFRERPKRPLHDRTTCFPSWSHPPTGIVLQGPIRHDDDFTLESIRYYARMFPDSWLILSTWENENVERIAALALTNLELVQSSYPDCPGPSHINYQIVSSINGLRRARQLGCEYLIKSRTDQRFYSPGTIGLCHAILNQFPIDGVDNQRQRLIGCSLNTYKYRLYPMSDMFLFGSAEDMLAYWDAPLDLREQIDTSGSMRAYSKHSICEVYFMTGFLKRIGYDLQWTLADSWHALGRHFAILDQSMLDLYWPKYSRAHQELPTITYTGSATDEEVYFHDWIGMYQHQQEIVAPEQVLDLHFRDPIPPEPAKDSR